MSESSTPYIHQRLFEKAKQNDKSAQGELYSLYCEAILNGCFRVVRDAYVAEDIMQDAFIEVFKNIKQHQESSTFGAWLKRLQLRGNLEIKAESNMSNLKLPPGSIMSEQQVDGIIPAKKRTNTFNGRIGKKADKMTELNVTNYFGDIKLMVAD